MAVAEGFMAIAAVLEGSRPEAIDHRAQLHRTGETVHGPTEFAALVARYQHVPEGWPAQADSAAVLAWLEDNGRPTHAGHMAATAFRIFKAVGAVQTEENDVNEAFWYGLAALVLGAGGVALWRKGGFPPARGREPEPPLRRTGADSPGVGEGVPAATPSGGSGVPDVLKPRTSGSAPAPLSRPEPGARPAVRPVRASKSVIAVVAKATDLASLTPDASPADVGAMLRTAKWWNACDSGGWGRVWEGVQGVVAEAHVPPDGNPLMLAVTYMDEPLPEGGFPVRTSVLKWLPGRQVLKVETFSVRDFSPMTTWRRD
jgi:hypothetical protein